MRLKGDLWDKALNYWQCFAIRSRLLNMIKKSHLKPVILLLMSLGERVLKQLYLLTHLFPIQQ